MIKLVLPIGIAGSGKSTFIRKLQNALNEKVYIISPDEIRFKMLDYPESGISFDEKIESEVWATAFDELYHYCGLKEHNFVICFDCTNLTLKRRYEIIGRMKCWIKNDILQVFMFHFKLPLIDVIKADSLRKRVVGETVLAKQFVSLEKPQDWECYNIFEFKTYKEADDYIRKVKDRPNEGLGLIDA